MSTVLHEITPDPIDDIERSITSETKDIMRSDVLDLTRFLEKEELWDNGDRFKKDGKGPDDFKDCQSEVKNDGADGSTDVEELGSESVMYPVVGVFVAVSDKIDSVSRGGEEEDLHNGIVKG